MRMIHTGDWHLNHRLGRENLTEDLERVVAQIVGYCRAKQADVLLIAGDLFSGRENREQLQHSLQFLKKELSPFLTAGGTVVALSGNHDSEAFFLTLRDALELVSPVRENADGVHASGRFYIAPNPRLLKLRGRGGQVVQFVLMPYPTPRAFLQQEGTRYNSIEKKNAAMAEVYHATLSELIAKVDARLPAVLAGHAQIRGVPAGDLFMAGDEHDVLIDLPNLPQHFAYGAFGHIHRPGAISQGGSHFRYCGSLLPLDAGEAGQAKSVVCVEIGQAGRIGEPELLPLAGPRLLDIVIEADAIGGLRTAYPDCGTALVKYRLRYDAAAHPDSFELHQQIRAIFPRWYDSLNEPRGSGEGASGPVSGLAGGLDLKNIVGNVQTYLSGQAAYAGDESEDDVRRLADMLLANSALMQAMQDPERAADKLSNDKVLMTAIAEVRI